MVTLLQCKLKPEDYIKAQYLHMRQSSWLKYLGIALLSLWLVVLVASVRLGFLTRTIGAFTLVFLLFGLVYALGHALHLFVILPWSVRRTFMFGASFIILTTSIIDAFSNALMTSSFYANRVFHLGFVVNVLISLPN